ncbi:hypothetical protein [Sciscionella marina]|nr:hypothetical protein [Sciscionella marina]
MSLAHERLAGTPDHGLRAELGRWFAQVAATADNSRELVRTA